MKILELILLGISQLRANALRSILTILGITIGTGAVLGVVSIGEGLRYTVVNQFAQVGGANLIFINPPNEWEQRNGRWVRRTWREHLTVRDLRTFRDEVPGIRTVYPIVGWNAEARHKKASTNAQVQGTFPGYDVAMDWDLDKGRFLADWDVTMSGRVCVIGDKVATELFPRGDPIGAEIKLGPERYTVIGTLKPRTQFGNDWGNQIVVPVTTLQRRVTGNDHYNMLFVYLQQDANIDAVTRGLRRSLRRLHEHGDEFQVRTGESILTEVDRVTTILKIVGGSVAGISLLVGGVGIMNIMLVSVTERTREIGIRKALGAKDKQILAQFVVESITLSLFGGALGILFGSALGLGISRIIKHYAPGGDFPSVIDPSAVALAVTVSAAIGLFFGVYPAAKASRLDPVDALRYE